MADEENWIKEKEQIVSAGDIGHDLTTINLLLSKHKVWKNCEFACSVRFLSYNIFYFQALENEIQSHEPQLLNVTAVGEELVKQGHFGAKSIQDRLDSTLGMWQHLLDLTAYRRKRLEEAVDFHQVIYNCSKFFLPTSKV